MRWFRCHQTLKLYSILNFYLYICLLVINCLSTILFAGCGTFLFEETGNGLNKRRYTPRKCCFRVTLKSKLPVKANKGILSTLWETCTNVFSPCCWLAYGCIEFIRGYFPVIDIKYVGVCVSISITI